MITNAGAEEQVSSAPRRHALAVEAQWKAAAEAMWLAGKLTRS
jgi:hypothetical protein